MCAPAGLGGRGLDLPGGGVRRQNLLAYDGEGAPYAAWLRDEGWSGRSLEQALQRLVAKDQRREQEEQRAAYARAVLRLLAEVAGDDVLLEEDGARGDFRSRAPADYEETGRGLSMGRPPAPWWTLVAPQLLEALMDRVETQVGGARHERLQRDEDEDEDVRRMLASLLSVVGPDSAPSGRRVRRHVENTGSAHRRSRRSLDDASSPSPSDQPPLLRVKRLDEEEAGLRRVIRRRALSSAPQVMLGYMRK
ncbi:proprotein convertase subtilisin/kexin type 1 inhibitor, like isoform X2 [Nerophis ophidion]|uniref:proprotein convertase subtilisin/kexin type 1 inhibitor, like isoform X2 n=1 Tax=Nerophis ophidion TaxID=159077 RepID=UPI002ADF69B0|nr:proprotein convertase subtilisin/kexin type 1 inhibitor, like isoform X2 [Nerophis ophidion]